MFEPMIWVVAVTVIGVAVTMPLYARLLKTLAQKNPEVYERLERPSLMMGSPRRGIALQRFIYFESQNEAIDPAVSRLCLFAAVLNVVLVLAVLAAVTFGARQLVAMA